MILAPTSRRIIRPYDKPSFEHTQRYGLIRGHPLGPAGGLVLLILANEGSGSTIFDLSGKANTGSLMANTHFVPGKFGGSALDFDGVGDYANTLLNMTGFSSGTILIWFSHSTLINPANKITERFIGSGRNAFLMGSHIDYPDNIDSRVLLLISPSAGNYYHLWGTKDTWLANTLYQVAATWDGTTGKMYVNGIFDNSSAQTQAGGWGGAQISNATYTWDGQLDLVVIYNRVLLTPEISESFYNPFCMVRKKAAPVYFFVPVAVGEVKELSGTVAISSTVTGNIFTIYGLSNYSENNILEHMVGKTSFTMPTAYVGLSTSKPSEDGTGVSEPSGLNYSRVTTAGGDWNNAADGEIDNANPITFDEASGNWGTITHYVVFDAPTGGNMLAYDILDVPKAINTEEIIQFTAGDLKIRLD